MRMRILPMFLFQSLSSGFEPVYLGGLEPVVAVVFMFIRTITMRIQQINRQRRVVRLATGKDFDVVISHAVDILGSGLGEGVGEGLDDGHLFLPS